MRRGDRRTGSGDCPPAPVPAGPVLLPHGARLWAPAEVGPPCQLADVLLIPTARIPKHLCSWVRPSLQCACHPPVFTWSKHRFPVTPVRTKHDTVLQGRKTGRRGPRVAGRSHHFSALLRLSAEISRSPRTALLISKAEAPFPGPNYLTVPHSPVRASHAPRSPK